jgi:putative nucleotidyltransferase with HDIG domain
LSSFAAFSAPARRHRPTAVEWYAVGLTGALGTLCLLLIQSGVSPEAPIWMLAVLASIAVLAEKQSVHISPNMQTSVSVLPILFAAVAYGPFEAMIVGACALATDFGRPYTRWVIWTGIRSLAGGTAGVVALLLIGGTSSFGVTLAAVAAAALAEALTDLCLTSLTAMLRGNGSLDVVRLLTRYLVATMPLYTPVIAVLAYAYEALSPWTVLLFFVPAVAAHRFLILYQEQRRLAHDLASANASLERAGLSFASALVSALDARDRYTAGHSAAVAVYARDIAARLGLSTEDQRLAHLCGLLHDIGKVGLPLGILEKTGSLNLDERRKMEEHSVIGERILANVEDYGEIARIVRHHHERVDGNGYPDGIRSDDIPLVSRILAVADAYNAMTSGRPYRDAMPSQVARLRLAQGVGSQFDTSVVAAFEAILTQASDPYRLGARADFAVEAQRHPALARVAASAA